MYNYCAFMGRLVADPELRVTPTNKQVCSFRIAVQRPYDKNSENIQADFINCVAWNGSAEAISKYFTKGSRILVSGRMQTRAVKYEESNTTRIFTELVVSGWEFVDYKNNSENKNYNNENETNSTEELVTNIGIDENSDDDLPF